MSTPNLNGILEIRMGNPYHQRLGGVLIGQIPNDLAIDLNVPITIRAVDTINLLAVEEAVVLVKEIRDATGTIISRTAITPQPAIAVTGFVERVEQDALNEPLAVPLLFLTNRINPPGDDPWNRVSTALFGEDFALTLAFDIPSGFPDGNYQVDLHVTSGTTRIARLIGNLAVLNGEAFFPFDPAFVWTHAKEP